MSFLQRAKNWQNSKISYEKARQSQDNFKVSLRKSKLQEELRIKRFASFYYFYFFFLLKPYVFKFTTARCQHA